MSLHDGRIKGGEIESGDGNVIITPLWLDDGRSFVLLVGAFHLESWDDVACLKSFSIKLRNDFDLLSARKEVVEGNSGYSSHFDVIDETHEFVHDSLRKISILHEGKKW